MAFKGTESKKEVTNKLLEVFNGAFISGKEIRIPVEENGEVGQLKIVLTAAQKMVQPDGAVMEAPAVSQPVSSYDAVEYSEPSQEEKDNLARLVAEVF